VRRCNFRQCFDKTKRKKPLERKTDKTIDDEARGTDIEKLCENWEDYIGMAREKTNEIAEEARAPAVANDARPGQQKVGYKLHKAVLDWRRNGTFAGDLQNRGQEMGDESDLADKGSIVFG
jgi:hypothetical protein